jgi:hypothetical protein
MKSVISYENIQLNERLGWLSPQSPRMAWLLPAQLA